jgi:hypothetical protein
MFMIFIIVKMHQENFNFFIDNKNNSKKYQVENSKIN